MDFKTAKFEAAVTSFKSLCPGHAQLFLYGQFYVTKITLDNLFGQISMELTSNLRISLQPDALAGAIAFFKAKLSVAVTDIAVDVIMAMLNSIELNGDMWAIKAMFTPSKTDGANARRDFDAIWSTTDIPGAPLWSPSATVGRAQAAFELEKDRCFQVLRSFARKLLKKRGISTLPPSVALSAGQVGGAALQHTTPATTTETGRDTIVYNAPPALAAAVATMKAAVDAGGYVHCGVLSGAVHEHSKFPEPEHHILVFAYDSIDGQDAFLFWDPDASHSNIASTSWGDGFGVLFSRVGRLSTAIDEADLAAIDLLKGNGPTFGNHTREPLRHCYQVYSVQTLPEKATVRLHTKILQPPVRSSIDEMLLNAVAVFSAYGIEVIEASREIVDTAGTDDDKFQTLFVGDGQENNPTAEVTALHENLRSPDREFGVVPAANEMVIAFVRALVPASIGCALHPEEKPGAVLSATLAGEWALANQIGRVLGLRSGADSDLLTFANTDGFTTTPPGLADGDVAAIKASPLTEA